MRQSKPKVVISVDEPTYSTLWYEPPDRRQAASPRLFPPPVKGEKPKVIPYRSVIEARPIYVYPLDWEDSPYPKVVDERKKMMRSARSATLGPNAYLVAGEVVAQDCFMVHPRRARPDYRGRVAFVVDCGVPLLFEEDYRPHWKDVPNCAQNHATPGSYVAGLVKLYAPQMGMVCGLFQPAEARVCGMLALGLDPNRPDFGRVRRVPFGDRLSLDPDFARLESVFAILEVDRAGLLFYKPFGWRSPDYPEPDLPGLVRLEE